MTAETPALNPDAFDAWLREHLGRRMTLLGFSLPATPGTYSVEATQTADPPALLASALEEYAELWVRWAARGVALPDALAEAATHDADIVLVWLPQSPPGAETGAQTGAQAGTASDAPPVRLLQGLIGAMEVSGLRDRCVVAVVGPGASRALGRRLGCDDGFGSEASPRDIVATLAREVTARAAFQRRGQSPPCYL